MPLRKPWFYNPQKQNWITGTSTRLTIDFESHIWVLNTKLHPSFEAEFLSLFEFFAFGQRTLRNFFLLRIRRCGGNSTRRSCVQAVQWHRFLNINECLDHWRLQLIFHHFSSEAQGHDRYFKWEDLYKRKIESPIKVPGLLGIRSAFQQVYSTPRHFVLLVRDIDIHRYCHLQPINARNAGRVTHIYLGIGLQLLPRPGPRRG